MHDREAVVAAIDLSAHHQSPIGEFADRRAPRGGATYGTRSPERPHRGCAKLNDLCAGAETRSGSPSPRICAVSILTAYG